jgi:diguanylate cyclase (GGDEF)-like protein/PAS domain S-box-containing protein
VLLVEDDASDAHLVRVTLRNAKELRFIITWVTTLKEARQQLYENPPDVLLLDLSLSDSTGLDTVRNGRQAAGSLPIIVLTGHDDTDFALQTLESGAQDYLIKGEFDSDRLVRAIRYAISRTKLEQRLRDSEQRMALALSSAKLGLWDWHIPSSAMIFSDLCTQMLGYAPDEIAPNRISWEQLIHNDDKASVNAALAAHLSGETAIYRSEHRMLHKDKHWIWIHDIGRVLEWNAQGLPLRAVGVHQDISRRKLAEARDYLLISALKAVGHGVIITDINAKIEWANPAFEKLTGYSAEEAIGHKPGELVRSGLQEENFYQNLWSTIRSGETWCGEMINKRKDGSLYNEELTIAPVKNEQGVVCHFVGIKQDITERKRMQEQLWEMATTDVLTGLINRRYFLVKLEEEFARTKRFAQHDIAVLMLDLDYFKRINDSYGHAVGDAVLKHFATLINTHLRKTDTAGRLGGEEFAIFLPQTKLSDALNFAQRFCVEVASAPLQVDALQISVTVSIGITMVKDNDDDYDMALIRADNALYEAKARGRNRVETKLD